MAARKAVRAVGSKNRAVAVVAEAGTLAFGVPVDRATEPGLRADQRADQALFPSDELPNPTDPKRQPRRHVHGTGQGARPSAPPLCAEGASPPPLTAFDPETIQRIVRESRREQGLPERISDPSVIARLATMVESALRGATR